MPKLIQCRDASAAFRSGRASWRASAHLAGQLLASRYLHLPASVYADKHGSKSLIFDSGTRPGPLTLQLIADSGALAVWIVGGCRGAERPKLDRERWGRAVRVVSSADMVLLLAQEISELRKNRVLGAWVPPIGRPRNGHAHDDVAGDRDDGLYRRTTARLVLTRPSSRAAGGAKGSVFRSGT